MNNAQRNIVLIGMPGAGKSTIGILLAKRLSMAFVDTDILIQTEQGCSLQDIVDSRGYLELRRIEERIILGLECRNHVIATGGSAVYSEKAVEHLKGRGVMLFLDVTIEELRRRIRDFDTRGIARRPGQSFEDLFEERLRLYRRYADITVACRTLSHNEVLAEISRLLTPGTTSTGLSPLALCDGGR